MPSPLLRYQNITKNINYKMGTFCYFLTSGNFCLDCNCEVGAFEAPGWTERRAAFRFGGGGLCGVSSLTTVCFGLPFCVTPCCGYLFSAVFSYG